MLKFHKERNAISRQKQYRGGGTLRLGSNVDTSESIEILSEKHGCLKFTPQEGAREGFLYSEDGWFLLIVIVKRSVFVAQAKLERSCLPLCMKGIAVL